MYIGLLVCLLLICIPTRYYVVCIVRRDLDGPDRSDHTEIPYFRLRMENWRIFKFPNQ